LDATSYVINPTKLLGDHRQTGDFHAGELGPSKSSATFWPALRANAGGAGLHEFRGGSSRLDRPLLWILVGRQLDSHYPEGCLAKTFCLRRRSAAGVSMGLVPASDPFPRSASTALSTSATGSEPGTTRSQFLSLIRPQFCNGVSYCFT